MPAPSSRPKGTIALLYGVAFPALTILLLLRQSGVPAANSIWAEDGPIFYSQALLHSFGHTLTTVYGGYFQLFPRLGMQIALLFPVKDAAAVIAVLGAMSVAALSLVVFHAARGHIASPFARSVLVGAMILLPVANGELLDNLVNGLWWLFFVTFWLLLWRPRTWTGSILAAAICLLATGSDPAVGLFLPLVIIRLLVIRGLKENGVVIGFGAGLLYQLLAIHDAGVQSTAAHATLQGVGSLFALRVGLGSFTGTHITNLIIGSHKGAWIAVGVVLLVGVLAIAWTRHDPAVILFVCSALVFAFLTFVIPVGIRGAAPSMTNQPAQVGSRYDAVPILLVLSAVIVEADRFRLRNRRSRANVGIVLCCLLLIPCWLIDFRTPNGRSDGPSWSAQVAQATAACHSGHGATQSLNTSPAGWTTPVPCSDLR